jgi:hypothetical protein
MKPAIRNLARLSTSERRLLVEALALMPRAAVAIRLRPFPQTVGFGSVPLGPAKPVDVARLSSLIGAVARRMPFRALCFEQGLTLQRMLRRRGYPVILHYGVETKGALAAHVWVTLEGIVIHGGETAHRFAEVGQWP